MSLLELPCTKDKCILLPICKSKNTIRCDSLFNYIDNEFIYNTKATLNEIYSRVSLILHNIKVVKLMTIDHIDYTYHITETKNVKRS